MLESWRFALNRRPVDFAPNREKLVILYPNVHLLLPALYTPDQPQETVAAVDLPNLLH